MEAPPGMEGAPGMEGPPGMEGGARMEGTPRMEGGAGTAPLPVAALEAAPGGAAGGGRT